MCGGVQAFEDAPPTLEQQLLDGERLLQDADVLVAELTERVRRPCLNRNLSLVLILLALGHHRTPCHHTMPCQLL